MVEGASALCAILLTKRMVESPCVRRDHSWKKGSEVDPEMQAYQWGAKKYISKNWARKGAERVRGGVSVKKTPRASPPGKNLLNSVGFPTSYSIAGGDAGGRRGESVKKKTSRNRGTIRGGVQCGSWS